MGTLTPGATYIYERAGDTVYAREVGSSERKIIGYSHTPGQLSEYPKEDTFLGMPVSKIAEWVCVLQEAENNPALQAALDRVKVTYYLSKEEKDSKELIELEGMWRYGG